MMSVDFLDVLTKYLEQVSQQVMAFLPNLFAALALLLAGWLLARLLRALTVRVAPRLYRVIPSRAFQHGLKTSGMEQLTSEVVGGIVYWLVLLLFLAAATEALGLPVVSALLGGLARYLPSVLAALLIVVAGVVLGNIARTAVATAAASARIPYGDVPGRVAQIVVLLISVVVAIDQIGIDITFLIIALATLLAATVSGLALAFALGARATVSNLLASHHLLEAYQVGQRVRIGSWEGRITEITRTAVVLDTPAGRARVPAKEFNETPSLLLPEGA